MAPYRGSRGARGGGRGGGRGGSRGRGRGREGTRESGKIARSGIRTRAGYRKFDSQRVKDVDSEAEERELEVGEEADVEVDDLSTNEDAEDGEVTPKVKAYSALLQSFQHPEDEGARKRKRRKLEVREPLENGHVQTDAVDEALDDAEEEPVDEEVDVQATLVNKDGILNGEDDIEDSSDPFEAHFANPDDNELLRRLKAVQSNEWRAEKQITPGVGDLTVSAPRCVAGNITRKANVEGLDDLRLKQRLATSSKKHLDGRLDNTTRSIVPYLFNYTDLLLGNRTPQNTSTLRSVVCLHSLNHILKGRDKVLKNMARLAHNPELDLRDQGFTRPKVLILVETRQMCAKYAEAIVQLFEPEQQENKQRFTDSFQGPMDDREAMPEDFRELFEGNNDNNFVATLKFTRKTLKFYSPFYTSDVLLASPLGLRRILENEDAKKRDHDFLSSIEILIVDQAAAMLMQNWANVESVLNHLNLQLKEAHGCDFSRVRPWYLEGHAKYFRQTIILSGYITPELNRVFNTSMLNVAGKAKLVPVHKEGAIASLGALGVKQTFSRFESLTPAADPDARHKFFTSALLPSLLRLPKPADGAKGILVFIPSYYDFLRLRNFFASSTLTQDISFGTIHEYSDVSSQRRTRSHFLSGRHSFLLYTQRAHHFYRLKLKGVKRVVLYGVPDNPVFYEEIVGGFLGTSLNEGRLAPEEGSVRTMFSKWDGLALERVVGGGRVQGMLGGKGDTFDFV